MVSQFTRVSKKHKKGWSYKEGVFITPQGDYIARVKKGGNYTTLSKHSNESEAKEAVAKWYENQKTETK